MFACPGTLIIADVRRSRSIFGFRVQSSAVGNDFLMYDAQTAFGSLLCLLALAFSLSLVLYARECRHRNLFLCFMGQESCKRASMLPTTALQSGSYALLVVNDRVVALQSTRLRTVSPAVA